MDKALAERIAFRIRHKFRKSAIASLFGNSSRRKQTHSMPLVQPSYRDHSEPCSYRTRLESDGATDESEELDLDHEDPTPLRRFPHDVAPRLPSWPYPDMRPNSSFHLSEPGRHEPATLIQRRPSIGSWTEVEPADFETDSLSRSHGLVDPCRRGSTESWTQIEASEVRNYSSFRTLRPALSGEDVYSVSLGGLSRPGSISYRARTDSVLLEDTERFVPRGMLLDRTLCDAMWRRGSFSEQMLEALTHPMGLRGRSGSRVSLTTKGEEYNSAPSCAGEVRDTRAGSRLAEEKAPEAPGSIGPVLPPLADDLGSAIGDEIWKAVLDTGESLQYEKYAASGGRA